MKIAYLHQYFATPDNCGGVRSFTISNGLIDAGHDVEIVTTSAFITGYNLESGWNKIQIEKLVVHVFRLDYTNKMNVFGRLWRFLYFSVAATVKLLRMDFELLYVTSTPLSVLVPAIIVKYVRSISFIFEVRDRWPEVPEKLGVIKSRLLLFFAHQLEKKGYEKASAVIALSSGIARSILNDFQIEEKILVIENFSELKLFEGFPRAESVDDLNDIAGYKILYAGTLGFANDASYLVRLSKAFKVQNFPVSIVVLGDGAHKEKLIALAKECDVLNENIFFFPSVSKFSLSAIYRAVDAAISTVIDNRVMWDNSANKFFDALAAGKPIIINHGGWQAEVIERESVGLVLPLVDLSEAAKSVLDLLEKDQETGQFSMRSKRLAKKYSPEQQLPKLVRLVESL